MMLGFGHTSVITGREYPLTGNFPRLSTNTENSGRKRRPLKKSRSEGRWCGGIKWHMQS